MLEKTTRVNFLYDFYQTLLTEKQRVYMQLYYLDDLSLGEIAEEYGVSRQAVYDNVRRTEAMLEDYEDKLKLFSKFRQRMEIIEKLERLILGNDKVSEEVLMLINALKDHE
ncbi:MAG TPA: putative DNA-binding protein [Sporosarcina sp.]|nr:putative DNA-binding protein [Sporosarcina sp.]